VLAQESALKEPAGEPCCVPAPALNLCRPIWRSCFLLEGVGLIAVLLCAAGLRLWDLDQNGHGNSYYAAAVRSMLVSGTNFVFGSFDPVGFVTIDKPPGAVWVQAASAALFGYSGRSLLIPQALMGVATVLVTYLLARRVAGPGAGLLAGLIVATTPISVAVDRDNLPDTALVLLLVLAAWAMSRAVETGRLRPLLLAVVLVGLAFNVKMLAAFIVLPTFYLAYLLCAPISWRSRLGHLATATVVLTAVSLSWAVVVELTPRDRRPYVGGSKTNSALELALGYNGLGRVLGGSGNPSGPMPGPPPGLPSQFPPPPGGAPFPPGGFPVPPGGSGLPPMPPGFGGMPGLGRFAGAQLAGQVAWLFPLALIAVVAVARFRRRTPVGPVGVAVFLWSGWLLMHFVVFSWARGIFHEYYTTVMAPAVAVLAGIGIAVLWRPWFQGASRRGFLLPAALVLTAAWQAFLVGKNYPDARRWLLPTVLAGVGVATAGILVLRWWTRLPGATRWAQFAAGFGLAVLLLGPVSWSLATVVRPGNSVIPSAPEPMLFSDRSETGMPPFHPFMGPATGDQTKLIEFLRANRHEERFLVVAHNVMPVAPIIIATGEPAIALGGFMGGDPVLTKDEFVRMVEEGQVRFVFGGPAGPPLSGPGGAMPLPSGFPGMGNREILDWIREHGKEVNPALWRSSNEPAGGGPQFPMEKLYDLKAERGLVDPSVQRR